MNDVLSWGYVRARQLPDGRWLGVTPMLFTAALCVDLTSAGYAWRYCYASMGEAVAALEAWDGQGDAPGNWIKRKGKGEDVLGPGATGEDT